LAVVRGCQHLDGLTRERGSVVGAQPSAHRRGAAEGDSLFELEHGMRRDDHVDGLAPADSDFLAVSTHDHDDGPVFDDCPRVAFGHSHHLGVRWHSDPHALVVAADDHGACGHSDPLVDPLAAEPVGDRRKRDS
jgi:hypothetical protein